MLMLHTQAHLYSPFRVSKIGSTFKVCLLLGSIALGSAWADLRYKYDQFDDDTTVSTKSVVGGWGHPISGFEASYHYTGKIPSKPRMVGLFFDTSNPNWVYLYGHDLTIIADGERYKAFTTNRIGKVSGRYVYETVLCYMNADDILKIIKSNNPIMAKLGATQFVFTTQMKAALVELGNSIQAIPVIETAAP